MAAEQQISHAYYNDTDEEDEDDDEKEEEEEEENSDECKSMHGTCRTRRGGWFMGKVLDPRATWVQEWNRVFLLVCAAGLFVDPLFFYALSISDTCMCLFVDGWFAVTVTVLRCMIDALHVWNMWLQLKMNRRPPAAVGGGERNRSHNSSGWVLLPLRYLMAKKGFLFDLFIILPLPQVQRGKKSYGLPLPVESIW
ncbi:unnamed protein product [Ilex paraguariensis]|uniref:Cyclic nucleotide-gated ion channel 4 n=1 Tax=Ilex paraguariensis TaxID=185542 RepID=A0ABC8SI93_9AQUA